MIVPKKEHRNPFVIDLTGPEGNAFSLMGNALKLYKLLGHTDTEKQALFVELTSGDYENLVNVFDREFGDFITLLR